MDVYIYIYVYITTNISLRTNISLQNIYLCTYYFHKETVRNLTLNSIGVPPMRFSPGSWHGLACPWVIDLKFAKVAAMKIYEVMTMDVTIYDLDPTQEFQWQALKV